MLDDIAKPAAKPGYSAIGRLNSLPELNGLIAAFTLIDGPVGAWARERSE